MAQRFTRPGTLYGCHGTKRSLALLCLQDGGKDVHSGKDITFARENERERGQKNGKGRPEGGREGWKFRGCVFESKAEKEFKCVYLTHRSPPSPKPMSSWRFRERDPRGTAFMCLMIAQALLCSQWKQSYCDGHRISPYQAGGKWQCGHLVRQKQSKVYTCPKLCFHCGATFNSNATVQGWLGQ